MSLMGRVYSEAEGVLARLGPDDEDKGESLQARSGWDFFRPSQRQHEPGSSSCSGSPRNSLVLSHLGRARVLAFTRASILWGPTTVP